MDKEGPGLSATAPQDDEIVQHSYKSAHSRDKEVSGFATTLADDDGHVVQHSRKLHESKNIVLSQPLQHLVMPILCPE
eukprot:CAMPEP_0173182534 /NCGR_PEP_ID=MMETSP1141-20130122/7894_1 /TAXON_ID=483371 /ORGANISM="non described non described, Strain CCMP2298" /LENGTH=77 /DNA_ID=CAMNT_0014105645 /DNA_START=241 /DNA_END=474 /DNA_ORIENTATION=+